MFKKMTLILFFAIVILTGCNIIAGKTEVYDGQKPFMLEYNLQNTVFSRTGIEIKDRKYYYITEYFDDELEPEILEGELTTEEITELVDQIINTYKFFNIPRNISVADKTLCDAPSEMLKVTYGEQHHLCQGYNIQDKRFRGIVGSLLKIYKDLKAKKTQENEN